MCLQVANILGSSPQKESRGAGSVHGRNASRIAADAANCSRVHGHGAAVAEGMYTLDMGPPITTTTRSSIHSRKSNDCAISTDPQGTRPDLQVPDMHVQWHACKAGGESARSRPRTRRATVAGAVAEGWRAASKFGARGRQGGYYDEDGERTVHGCVVFSSSMLRVGASQLPALRLHMSLKSRYFRRLRVGPICVKLDDSQR